MPLLVLVVGLALVPSAKADEAAAILNWAHAPLGKALERQVTLMGVNTAEPGMGQTNSGRYVLFVIHGLEVS